MKYSSVRYSEHVRRISFSLRSLHYVSPEEMERIHFLASTLATTTEPPWN